MKDQVLYLLSLPYLLLNVIIIFKNYVSVSEWCTLQRQLKCQTKVSAPFLSREPNFHLKSQGHTDASIQDALPATSFTMEVRVHLIILWWICSATARSDVYQERKTQKNKGSSICHVNITWILSSGIGKGRERRLLEVANWGSGAEHLSWQWHFHPYDMATWHMNCFFHL